MALKLNIDQLLAKMRETNPGLTQKDIAELAEVDEGLLSRYINNRVARVDLETLDKLFKAFDIEPGPLFRREDEGRPGGGGGER